VKWFLIGLVGVACSTWAHGDPAGDLYSDGTDALADEKYDVAAKDFDQILTGYPNTPNIDDVHLRAGFAYLHTGDFPSAIDRLKKETLPDAKPEFRATALYFTGLAWFSQGQKATDKAASAKAFSQAADTLSTLLDYIKAAPTPDNQDYTEDTIYYRSLAYYQEADYAKAEVDLKQLLAQFSASLKRPDYLLLLGSLYAVQTNQAVVYNNDPKNAVKKTPEEIKALAQKALDTFDKVTSDPNALVQANDANMSKAEVLYLIAQLEPDLSGYQKALDAFRLVRRKDDMIAIQTERLAQLKKMSQDALRNGPGGTGANIANANGRLIDRETSRLTELKDGPDPIIQALVRMAECYVSLKQPDEARTVLRRLVADAQLNADQQEEVDFQLLSTYAMGGQTDKADKALTDYLTKHPADPQADSISYQIAAKLIDKKDNAGALAECDRGLKDFPNGRFVGQTVTLKAQALTNLGRVKEAQDLLTAYAEKNKDNPAAVQMVLVKAQGEIAQGDFKAALADYESVLNNPKAKPDLQTVAAAGHIQALQQLQRYDDVIAEAKTFADKHPDSNALPGILVFSALAMDRKNDPGAVAALQDVAQKYPKDDAASFALFYIVNIYQRTGNAAGMIQAAQALSAAYPTSYTFISESADMVSAEYLKEKKYDLAVAQYQPLLNAPKPDLAAGASNKIGDVYLTQAKGMGAYQSMQVATRKLAEQALASAEQAYLTTLKKFPDQVNAVGDAFEGIVNTLKLRRSWGKLADGSQLTDANMAAYLDKLGADFTDHDMKTRFDLAKDGLVFVYKKGEAQYPAALAEFKNSINPNPQLRITRQEATQYGELLIAAKEYPTALQVFSDLLSHAAATDQVALGDAYYGLGATYLAQGDVAKAAENFKKLTALPGGGLWHPRILDAQYGIALAQEQSTSPDDNTAATQAYATLMQSQAAGITLQAKAMLGYGRLLEKAGHGVAPAVPGTIEYAVHYYQQVHLFYGLPLPALGAEGLYDAGQAYEKANDTANAKKQYTDLVTAYDQTAHDWADKARAALTKLGP